MSDSRGGEGGKSVMLDQLDHANPISRALPALAGALTSLVAVVVFPRGHVPFEDAAILFRYSENLANGLGVVYNPGGPRVDGATDMLFMALIAVLIKLGLSTVLAAAILNALGFGLLIFLIMYSWIKWSNLPLKFSLIPIVLILLGPAWLQSIAGFGTVFFCALCALVTLSIEWAYRSGFTRKSLLLVALFASLCGLDRPEGFLISGALLLCAAVVHRSWQVLWIPALVLVPIGVAWVAWRWSYFGYPLPNPFYKKGGGSLYEDGFRSSLSNLKRTAIPFLAVAVIGAGVRESRRRSVAVLAVFAYWCCLWALLSDEMNFWGRFQYPIIGLLAISCASVAGELRASEILSSRIRARSVVVVVLIFSCLGCSVSVLTYGIETIQTVAHPLTVEQNMPASVSQVLERFKGSGNKTIASSEAGFVGWKSGWKVTDLWGLNDKKIAHDGYLSEQELRNFKPDVIFVHWCKSNQEITGPGTGFPCLKGWELMTDPLQCFIDGASYKTAGLWIDDWDYSWGVYVNPKFPRGDALIKDFRLMPAGGRLEASSQGPLPGPTNPCPDY